MSYRSQPPQMPVILPLTKVVKRLIIANVLIWFFGIVILEQYFLSEPKLTFIFGLEPLRIIKSFFLWQPFTYLFIHSSNPTHVIFNMLLLWWLGSELERAWGSKFFTLFYFVSGVGAALLYSLAVFIYSIITGRLEILLMPVIGASAAIFGLLVAYGMMFGERVVLFMFFFPMKAKYFVMILGGIEVVMVLNNGLVQGKVANLAHVGGLITGFVFLKVWPYLRGGSSGGNFGAGGGKKKKASRKLKLVVNNDDFNTVEKPKFWN
jgi:membrane associated rhomboid family serine protease